MCVVTLFWCHLQLNKSEVCINLPLVRNYKVARVHDAVARVYDYYEPSEYDCE